MQKLWNTILVCWCCRAPSIIQFLYKCPDTCQLTSKNLPTWSRNGMCNQIKESFCLKKKLQLLVAGRTEMSFKNRPFCLMDVRSFSSFHTHTLRTVMFQYVVAWSKKYGCTCTKTIICKEPLRIGEAIRQQNNIGVFAHRMCIQILFVHNTLCIPVYMYTCTCTPVCTSAVRTFWTTQMRITANKATCTCMLNYHQFITEKNCLMCYAPSAEKTANPYLLTCNSMPYKKYDPPSAFITKTFTLDTSKGTPVWSSILFKARWHVEEKIKV